MVLGTVLGMALLIAAAAVAYYILYVKYAVVFVRAKPFGAKLRSNCAVD